jgi:lysyl-tRNA synthetase class 2
LQPIYGGAAAKPFVTHHNQLKQDLYLRISFELYLKRLSWAVLTVYTRSARLPYEGVSYKHNPEFTQLSLLGYADYLKVMELTEKHDRLCCDKALGTRKVTL